jgi:phosphate/sulfate permease
MTPGWRKHAMHGAAFVAVLGVVLGGGQFFRKLPGLLRGADDVNQRAMLFTGVLVLICAIYLVLSIRSFIAARRARATPA